MNRSDGPSEIAKTPRPVRPLWAWSVLAIIFLLLPLIGMGLQKVRLSNDTESWLPLDDPHGEILRWHQDLFSTNETIVISWEGSTLNDPRVEALARRLRGDTGDPVFGVGDATSPHDALEKMVDLDVPQDEAIRRLRGTLIGTGFLKVRLTEHGRQHREQAERLLEEAGAHQDLDVAIYPAVIEPQAWLQLPAAEDEESVVVRPFPVIPEHDLQLRWREISEDSPKSDEIRNAIAALEIDGQKIVEESFFAVGAPVAVTVAVTEEGRVDLPRTMRGLHEAAENVGIDSEDLHLGGGPIVSHRLSTESARALWNPDHPVWVIYKRSPVLLSAIVGMLIAFVVLRSMWMAAIVMLLSVYSAAGMLAIVGALGVELNLVLVVMPNLLMVLTLSGCIHLANYWSHAVVDGDPRPVRAAVRTAGLPAFLASLTTAIGLLSLLTSKLSPVRDFGWYSAWGCMLSLFLILGALPAILALFPPRGAHAIATVSARWQALGEFIRPRYKAIAWSSIALTAIGCWGLLYFKTETKGIRYFPEELRIVQDYRYLEESLSGILNIDVDIYFPPESERESDEAARSFDRQNVFDRMEIVHRVQEAIAEHPVITGTMSVVDFQVIPERPDAEASRQQRVLYGRQAQRTENELFYEPREGATQFVHLVMEPLQVAPDDRSIDWHTGGEIWRIRAQCSVMADLNFAQLLREVDYRVASTLEGENDADYAITGLVPLMLRTQQAVLDSLINSFGLSFLFIVIVRAITMRTIVGGFITMFPNFLPVLVVFGMISWAGIAVDMGTMITASVALGIADDCTLHLLTWFQEGIRRGLDRKSAVSMALKHCGPAMWQTSVCISLGLLMLWGADLLLISRFGWMMAAQIMLALLADIVLTPSLLYGKLGQILENANRPKAPIPPPSLTITQSAAQPTAGESAQPAAQKSVEVGKVSESVPLPAESPAKKS